MGGGGGSSEDPDRLKKLKFLRDELNRQGLARQQSGLSQARTILSAISQTSPTSNANLLVNPAKTL